MGVRGLTTYINSNQNAFLQEFYLHDSNLVVDGHSLCCQLYHKMRCFSAFGGEYDKFAAYVKNFFKSLRKCNINPYVLFDGSYETRKLRTAYTRLRSKIYGVSRLDPVTQGRLQIFPLLLRDVFKEVLDEMEVAYTICEFEADDEIAAMARHLNCPVLSYDSDFFIYNVLYIPFNTLELKPQVFEENGNKYYALECRIFKIENLTSHFGGLSQEKLPLLATLLGNDFVQKRVFNKFFSQLKLSKSRQMKNEQQRCIHTLLKWLQTETLDSAIAKILGRLTKDKKAKVFKIIKKSLASYSNTYCHSLKYFNIDSEPEVQELEIEMPEIEDCEDNAEESEDELTEEKNCEDDGEDSLEESNDENVSDSETYLGLPEWFAEGIRQKYIPQYYIDLYTNHLHFCSPQAEDCSEEDSFLCTLPILRFAFDILTDFAHENIVYVSRENSNNYKRIFVSRDYSIPRPLQKPYSELSVEELRSYFHHLLNVKLPLFDATDIEVLPPNFQLFMISLLWWVSYCSVPLNHVHSLFLCYIMLEVIDEKTGTFRGHNFFNNKYSKKLQEIKRNPTSGLDQSQDTELFLNKNKVQYEDCLLGAAVLLKLFEIDDSIKKRPKTYDVKRIHSFAQFQCCLLQFNSLNTLCREPYEATKYSKCYNGIFIYNIALKLENQVDPINFFEQYLKGAKTILKFYISLCAVYEKCAEKMGLCTTKVISKKRRGRRKQKTDDEIYFITKGFESEVVI